MINLPGIFLLPAALRVGLSAAALGLALPVLAQAIAVTTPRLPPRGTATAPQQTAQPAVQAGSQVQAQASPQAGASPGANTGIQSGTQSPAYPGSQLGAYAGSAAPTGGYAAPAAAMVVPPRAAPGACRVQLTPDRQALMLVSGTEALARQHAPLGEFRAQQVVHSPDGRWAVAYTKLRGAPQYAAMTIDLERCEVERVIELDAAGQDVRFEGDEAVLSLSNGERRLALRDGRVK